MPTDPETLATAVGAQPTDTEGDPNDQPFITGRKIARYSPLQQTAGIFKSQSRPVVMKSIAGPLKAAGRRKKKQF